MEKQLYLLLKVKIGCSFTYTQNTTDANNK